MPRMNYGSIVYQYLGSLISYLETVLVVAIEEKRWIFEGPSAVGCP
jgi:hypothetical protein